MQLSVNAVKNMIADVEKLEKFCAKKNSNKEFHRSGAQFYIWFEYCIIWYVLT